MVKNLYITSIENSKKYFKKDEESEYFGDTFLVIYDKINELIDEVNDLKKENEELKRKVDLL